MSKNVGMLQCNCDTVPQLHQPLDPFKWVSSTWISENTTVRCNYDTITQYTTVLSQKKIRWQNINIPQKKDGDSLHNYWILITYLLEISRNRNLRKQRSAATAMANELEELLDFLCSPSPSVSCLHLVAEK